MPQAEQVEPDESFSRAMHIRAIREEAREADFVCSTEAVDSYGTILRQPWNLTRYEANPVVLYAHQSYELPIGQGRKTRVEGAELVSTVWFSDVHQRARESWELVLEQTLRGISVRFYPNTITFEKLDGQEVMVFSDLELLELSVCPVPSNPEALAKARARALGMTGSRTTKTSVAMPPGRPALERGAEKSMLTEAEQKALESKLAMRDAEITIHEKTISELKTERTALEAQTQKLVTERDQALSERDKARKEASDANDLVVERDVDAFVGKKITPAEKESFLELARTSRKLFDKMMEQRSPLSTETDTEKTEDEKAEARTGSDDDGSRSADKLKKRMRPKA